MKTTNKFWYYSLIILSVLLSNCKKEESTPVASVAATIVATEDWTFIIDSDSNNNGHQIHTKKSDGSITSSGSWTYQGTVCPFQDALLLINDTIVSFTATGTATNPAAPAGYNTSPFTLKVNSVAHNGKSYETYNIVFTTFGWPPSLNGISTGKRNSGSGVTN